MSNNGVTIKITNSTITGKSRLLNDAHIKGTAEIIIDGLHASDEAEVLENINIDEFSYRLSEEILKLSPESEEYQALLKLTAQIKGGDKHKKLKAIRNHILHFVEGVAINIISNMYG